MSSLILLVKPIFKSKWFWIGILLLTISLMFIKIRNKNFEIDRLNGNIKALNSNVQILKTKNNEAYYKIDGLTLDKSDLKKYNKDLLNELNDMNIKLKNVHSITQLSYNYYKKYGKIDSEPIIIKDTIFIPYVNDKSTNVKSYVKQFKFEQKESDNSVSGNINIPSIYNFDTKELTFNENINPYITDLDIKINDTLLVVPTINYKRVWLFWRRPKSISVFVKSSSKLFNLEQIQTIQITK